MNRIWETVAEELPTRFVIIVNIKHFYLFSLKDEKKLFVIIRCRQLWIFIKW